LYGPKHPRIVGSGFSITPVLRVVFNSLANGNRSLSTAKTHKTPGARDRRRRLGIEAVSVWGSGDNSQKALWDDYAAAYLSHKDSVDMLFINDTGSSGLSRFTGTHPELSVYG
jgi:hypothetical protein